MTREASVATLRRLAEAVDEFERAPNTWAKDVMPALRQYRSEIAPLRTREQVDAEIAQFVRACTRMDGMLVDGALLDVARDLCRLVREPTAPKAEPFHHRVAEALGLMDGDNGRYLYADESGCLQEIRENRRDAENWREHRAAADSGPSSADAEEVPSPRPPASPAGAAISRCPFCNMAGVHLVWCQYPRDSGPPGAVAAKESRDNAAAPEGAAKAGLHGCNPGERECNCDQALHLEKRIGDAVRAIRRSNTIPAGLLHELLGILEGEA